jgi:hypothetical protein
MSNEPERAVFLLRLRALPHVDGIKMLRRLLKYALRQCGLRALSVSEDKNSPRAHEGQKG